MVSLLDVASGFGTGFQAANKTRLANETAQRELAQSDERLALEREKLDSERRKASREGVLGEITKAVGEVDQVISQLNTLEDLTPEQKTVYEMQAKQLAEQFQTLAATASSSGAPVSPLNSAMGRLNAAINSKETRAQRLERLSAEQLAEGKTEREVAQSNAEFIDRIPPGAVRDMVQRSLVGGAQNVFNIGNDKNPGGMGAAMTLRYQKAIEGRQEGRALSSSVAVLDELLNMGTPTGADEQALLRFKQLTKGLGIVDAEKLSRQELFQAITNKVVLPQVKQLGRNPTDVDLKFIVDANPGLGTSEAGNRLLVELLKLEAQRSDFLATEMTKFLTENESRLDDPRLALQWDARLDELQRESELFTTAPATILQKYADSSLNSVKTPDGEPVIPQDAIPFDGDVGSLQNGRTYSFRLPNGEVGVGVFDAKQNKFITGN
jgi:hypothetical protein